MRPRVSSFVEYQQSTTSHLLERVVQPLGAPTRHPRRLAVCPRGLPHALHGVLHVVEAHAHLEEGVDRELRVLRAQSQEERLGRDVRVAEAVADASGGREALSQGPSEALLVIVSCGYCF